jgi:hypothetical protein
MGKIIDISEDILGTSFRVEVMESPRVSVEVQEIIYSHFNPE